MTLCTKIFPKDRVELAHGTEPIFEAHYDNLETRQESAGDYYLDQIDLVCDIYPSTAFVSC
jgi:hypothetical protein